MKLHLFFVFFLLGFSLVHTQTCANLPTSALVTDAEALLDCTTFQSTQGLQLYAGPVANPEETGSGIILNLRWEEPGQFTLNPDGSATITGTLQTWGSFLSLFSIVVDLTSPQACGSAGLWVLNPSCENGIDPTEWCCFSWTATLTGLGTGPWAGIQIVLLPSDGSNVVEIQVGEGADKKNLVPFGISTTTGSFGWEVTTTGQNCQVCTLYGHKEPCGVAGTLHWELVAPPPCDCTPTPPPVQTPPPVTSPPVAPPPAAPTCPTCPENDSSPCRQCCRSTTFGAQCKVCCSGGYEANCDGSIDGIYPVCKCLPFQPQN